MKPLKLTPALRKAAERCIWYEKPEDAAREPAKLAAHILTYGSLDDINALRAQYDEDDLRAALDAAPPGIFDVRSWTYWNLVIGRFDAPPMPERRFD